MSKDNADVLSFIISLLYIKSNDFFYEYLSGIGKVPAIADEKQMFQKYVDQKCNYVIFFLQIFQEHSFLQIFQEHVGLDMRQVISDLK